MVHTCAQLKAILSNLGMVKLFHTFGQTCLISPGFSSALWLFNSSKGLRHLWVCLRVWECLLCFSSNCFSCFNLSNKQILPQEAWFCLWNNVILLIENRKCCRTCKVPTYVFSVCNACTCVSKWHVFTYNDQIYIALHCPISVLGRSLAGH